MDKQLDSLVSSLQQAGMVVQVRYILHDGDDPLMVVFDLQAALEEGTFVEKARILREVVAERSDLRIVSRDWVF